MLEKWKKISDLVKALPMKKKKSVRKKQPKWSLRNKLCAPIWKVQITKEMRNKILTNESINTVQTLLAKQLSGISGIMDACLGKMRQFELIPVDKPNIQLFNAGFMR